HKLMRGPSSSVVPPERRGPSPVPGRNRPAADHPVAVVKDGGLPGREGPLRLIELDVGKGCSFPPPLAGEARVGAQWRDGGARLGRMRANFDGGPERRRWSLPRDVACVLDQTAPP